MRSIVFDIETGALPEAELEKSLPPFDPSEVKTGNMTDPRKIAAKIADAEAKHRRDYFERAALDPLTGRVLAVGLLYPATSEFVVLGDDGIGRSAMVLRYVHGRDKPLYPTGPLSSLLPSAVREIPSGR